MKYVYAFVGVVGGDEYLRRKGGWYCRRGRGFEDKRDEDSRAWHHHVDEPGTDISVVYKHPVGWLDLPRAKESILTWWISW